MTSPPLAAVVEGFRRQLAARGLADEVAYHETHISLVLLAGEYAWKFKKPVDFGFVDFSTLEKRRRACEREVALNRRYAPDLYLGVESIVLPDVTPSPCEYAVRMRRFANTDLLNERLARGAADAPMLADFGRRLAAWHAATPAASDATLGSAALFRAQWQACLGAPLAARLPNALRAALEQTLSAALPLLAARRAAGRVRACHGDLHCANVVAAGDTLLPFDCIEFNDELAVIDTLSDAAFLLMDLDARGAPGLGHAFMNPYLEAADEVPHLGLLPALLAYRALVRAKVALLRAAQDDGERGDDACRQADAQVALATRYLARDGGPGLVITHGPSGSGKSFHAARLASAHGFVHLRSDIERRRLAGLALDARSGSTQDRGLYTPAATRATYARLLELARAALTAGFSVVVDATFLDAAERAPFRALAEHLHAPFHLLRCEAPVAELERRIEARAAAGKDVSEATVEVLADQLARLTPLTREELTMSLDATAWVPGAADVARLGRARPH
ncbi:MAG: AAA family ATPase [Gammaproteobacteria bacterium]